MYTPYQQQHAYPAMDPNTLFSYPIHDLIDSVPLFDDTVLQQQTNYDHLMTTNNHTSDLYLTNYTPHTMLTTSSTYLHPLHMLQEQQQQQQDDYIMSPSVEALLFKDTTSLNYLGFDIPMMPNVFDSGESRFSESNRDEEEEEQLLSPVQSPQLGESHKHVFCNSVESQSITDNDSALLSNTLNQDEFETNDAEQDLFSEIDQEEEEDDDDDYDDDSDSDWESHAKLKRSASLPSAKKKPGNNKSRSSDERSLSFSAATSSIHTAENTCSNCATTNTPLWRRNLDGSPLCNACGLFLKLHGKVRPLCLKTDVIKKRNRTPSRRSSNHGIGKNKSTSRRKKNTRRKSKSRGRTTDESGN